MELTSKNVREVLSDCFAGEDHNKEDLIIVEGLTKSFGFSKEKLNKNYDNIYSMLLQLPNEFRKSEGGGWSFLNACMRSDECHWGEHVNMEELFVLGIGIEKVEYLFPREMWKILPGGVPYLVIIDN